MNTAPPRRPTAGKLTTLRPRDTHHAKAISAEYSRFVGLLRWILPSLIVIAMATLILWPRWGENALSLTVVDNVPNLMVEKLNLNGLDAENQRYTLTADRALQAANIKNLINLEKPRGEISTKNGGWLIGQAERGRLDQSSKMLWFGGNVELFQDQGYHFTSAEINVDMDKSAAWGNQPVVISGDFGEIQGGGFHLTEAGKVVVIIGPAKAKLYLQGPKSSDKPKNKPNGNHSPSR